MNETSNTDEELKKELAYYKKQLDQLSGESIRHDYQLTSLQNALKQKKEAFAILTILQKQYSVSTPLENLFAETVKAININLGMDRSVVLIPGSSLHSFKLSHWYGFPQAHFREEGKVELKILPDYLKAGQYILVNKAMLPDATGTMIQNILSINYFIGVPVVHDDQPIAFIISGRQFENFPFRPSLDKADIDTLTAITSLISAVIQNKKTVELKLQKAEIEQENKIISAQRDLLERTLNELKKAQAQLIQSEKMASLGELTAGIAHEIQNPLNFVNNFSEVNKELIEELKIKNEKLKIEDEEVNDLINDIKDNSEKINHHGKRADAIVKGMLQHSRKSSGQKEPTDINALVDEYLRLSYHGLRAKDKSFNAILETHFDPSVGKVNIVGQDVGRVLLNLLNNAFYAVSEKKKQQPTGYEPTVTVSTKKVNGTVEIKVADNGTGIPEKVLEKIYQPFFTTKPTGEGTGLGLSLSYDIITKGHGGEMKVETLEGLSSTFIIQLPA